MIICIDPGHGGKDPGAIGRDPFTLWESDLVWSIAVATYTLLPATNEVFLSRGQSEYVSLSDRVRAANDGAANIFVSIHANASNDASANGFEVWHSGSGAGARLALCVLDRVSIATSCDGMKNRGIKAGNFTVLTRTNMPAVLVECGFMTNPLDLMTMATARYQKSIAEAICGAVSSFGG